MDSSPSGPRLSPIRRASRYLLALFFLAAGLNHFRSPQMYMAIMPAYLPWHWELVIISGAAEAALGLSALAMRADPLTRPALLLLLVAVFPANLQMALHAERYPAIPEPLLWLRLPLQLLLAVWVIWSLPGGAASRRA